MVNGPSGPIPNAEVEVLLDSVVIGRYQANSSGLVTVPLEAGPGSHLLVAKFAGRGRIGASLGALKFQIGLPPQPPQKGGAARWTLLLTSLVLASILILHLWRRRVKALTPLGAYQAMLELFDRAGLPRRPSQTPREYVSWLEARGARGVDHARRITQVFEEQFYGQREVDPERVTAVKASLAELRELLHPPRIPLDDLVRRARGLIRSLLPA